jgi:hypothetical protein
MLRTCQKCGFQTEDDKLETCLRCGTKLPDVTIWICPSCNSTITDPNVKYCPKCLLLIDKNQGQSDAKTGTQFPDAPHKMSKRSFKYSTLFKFVVYTDLILCFVFGIVGIYDYFNVSSQANYPADIYLLVAFSANIILDLLLLKNKKQTPDSIDIRICWIKGLIGVLGLLTFVSGLYFIINSIRMKYSYYKNIKKQKNEEVIAKSNPKREFHTEIENKKNGKEIEENNKRIWEKTEETSGISLIIKSFFYFVLICGILIVLSMIAYRFSNGNYAISISIIIVGLLFGFLSLYDSTILGRK